MGSDHGATEFLVFLIDVHPLMTLDDPTEFIASLVCATESLLRLPTKTQFIFKLFFSSLSRTSSSKKLQGLNANAAYFLKSDKPDSVYETLKETLFGLKSLNGEGNSKSYPRASNIADCILNLVQDSRVKNARIFLFSAITDSFNSLETLFGSNVRDNGFPRVLLAFFGNANDYLRSSGSMISWCDVLCGAVHGSTRRELFKRACNAMGWRFTSTDDILQTGVPEMIAQQLTDQKIKARPYNLRARKPKIKTWALLGLGDLLAELGKEADLCLRAVCCLYRQQTMDEKIQAAAKHRNNRGFSKKDAYIGSMYANYLTKGETSGIMKLSVREFRRRFGVEGVEQCRDIAMRHATQLLEILDKYEDKL